MHTRIWTALLILASITATAAAADEIVGRWDLKVEPNGYPSWIGVTKDGSRHKVEFLWMGGGVENPPDKAKVEGDKVMFRSRDMNWVGTAKGDEMTGTATEDNGKANKFTGKRFVPDIDASGKWTIKAAAQSGKPPLLTLLQKGSQIAGSYQQGRNESPVEDAHVVDGVLSFRVDTKTNEKVYYEGRVKGDLFEGMAAIKGRKRPFTATRERDWGRPTELFNGKDLTGWKPLGNPKDFHWKAVDGVMTNSGRGANIVTEKTFRDFKLHVEFRVPKHSNSGVYLRGRYEIQVEDSYGQKPGGGSCGALYSRIVPSENASKPSDEWQTFDATLIGQYVTVLHNGKKIIDNQEIEGITGGAIDSNEHEPGPIYFQGDHGSVEYRKVTIWTSAEPPSHARSR